MHLISLTVRNYRVHQERTLRFDKALNVVGGPNEAGKTTLVEAAHRALFLRANVTGATRDEMITRPHGGHPEVELEFAAGGATWTLHKRFSGSTGTTRLSSPGATTLSGDEAEARLAALLGGEEAVGGRQASQITGKWGHLWVWQGMSGSDPSESATNQSSLLIQRLQAMGGVGVYLSATDSRVAEQVQGRYDDLFTKAGKPRAGSDVEATERDRVDAEASVQQQEAAVLKLDEAARAFRAADEHIRVAEAAHAKLTAEHLEVRTDLKQAEALQRDRETQAGRHEHARGRLEEARRVDGQIRDLVDGIQALEASLEPRRAALAALSTDLETRRATRKELGDRADAAGRDVRDGRRLVEVARALTTIVERTDAFGALDGVRGQVETLQGEAEALTRTISELPAVTEEVLKQLRDLDRARARAEDRLTDIAAEVEVIESGDGVRLGDEPLASGGRRVVTEVTELRIGDATRIRIRPGGGEGLETVRAELKAAAAALSDRLDELGCASLDAAADARGRRAQLEADRAGIRAKIEALAGKDFEARLRRAREELTEAAGALKPLGEAVPEALPALDEIRERRRGAEAALHEREGVERRLADELAAVSEAVDRLEREREEQRHALRSDEDELGAKRSNLKLLEDGAGGDAARAESIRALASEHEEEARALAATDAALAELDPGQLRQDDERLARAIERQSEARADADRRRVHAGALLESNGSLDPYADLKAASAALDRAREREAAARLRADAVALLHQTFEAEKQELARNLAAPLEERVNEYLRAVFADGSEIALDMDGMTFLTPALRREERFEFKELSGGAREQFAAAVRLAVAEVLAEEHDGVLPMFFDDAFAYSDPERVKGLVRALDLAASRGVQVLLLTCTPEDYAGLGATVIRVDRPTTAALSPSGSNGASPALVAE